MEVVCPIDEKRAPEISALLRPPPPREIQDYFDRLLASRECCRLKVKQDGEHGKGVYADVEFKEGELLLRDQMLFGCQHPLNKIDCLVCSFCFRFIGTLELQIGRRLFFQDLGLSSSHGCDTGACSDVSNDHGASDSSDGDDIMDERSCDDSRGCASGSKRAKVPLPKEIVESLMNGEIVLPYSDKFSAPPVVPCAGGCQEAYYCSKACADADWNSFHSLLCTGEKSEAFSAKALLQFMQHANETNDIFILAAKAIAYTILRYRKSKANFLTSCKEDAARVMDKFHMPLLLEAWKPISVGHKRRWWECIALPEDVDPSDEAGFRMEIKELAFKSLQLLKAAIFDKECEPLFSLDIYGHIIGMFELNNLDLVVASPVEDYFLYIDDLPSPEKEEAKKVSQPYLDALGDEYAVSCEGTAFFPLQSCMNHSCHPNAKAFKREKDRDGQATIVALKPIPKGEEVTISYIDEDLPVEGRQVLLADYGFTCKCSKCQQES
ncbi:histone-lysine N-methyltransferase ATXR2 isoform X2 [Rhodamnia argentea]|uniref:Histone-lysine N-methyltransferase ATXR2 isoform X2 n=1 Tax=Rhodamnia argentea TaxID=178133 RepID=A0A8B8QDM9_9MYRT|nr:histone-lysine N-methyltransferase ATXR2 isoform X2 [Rhodamnia argentea]